MEEWLCFGEIRNIATTVDTNTSVTLYSRPVLSSSLRRLTHIIFVQQHVETEMAYIGEITQEGIPVEVNRLFDNRFIPIIKGRRRQVFFQGTHGSCYVEKAANMYTIFQYEQNPDFHDTIPQKERGRFFGAFTVTTGQDTTLRPEKLVYGIHPNSSYETAHFVPQEVHLGK